MKSLTIAIAVLAVSVFGQAPAHAVEYLSGSEIKSLFAGKKVAYPVQPPGATKARIERYEFGRDGKLVVRLGGRGPFLGRWWAEDDRICREYAGAKSGATLCYFVNSRGGNKAALHTTGGEYVRDIELTD